MTKMSWSRKLFLAINAHVGKNRVHDQIMMFASSTLIVFFGFCVFVWALLALSPELFTLFVKMLLTAIVFGLGFNWIFGLLWSHPRPIVELVDIRVLTHTLTTLKAFPSDHATISFTLFFLTLIFGAPIWVLVIFFLCACVVSMGRIYCGVHYPRDIVGGFFVSAFFCTIAYTLTIKFSEPAYVLLKSILS